MAKFAIIQLQGKQYTVHTGDTLVVDRMELEEGKTVTIKDVLLTHDTSTTVGTPTVNGASVTLKAVSHDKGDKIRVFKYKSKSRYRKTYGHRQHQTTLEVTKIAV